MTSSSTLGSRSSMAPPEARVRQEAADRDPQRTRALREPQVGRCSSRRGRIRLGDHLLDPPSRTGKQFRRRLVEISHDACIERCLALRRRHLLQLRCGDDPRRHEFKSSSRRPRRQRCHCPTVRHPDGWSPCRTSGSRSTPFGRHIVPATEPTVTPAKVASSSIVARTPGKAKSSSPGVRRGAVFATARPGALRSGSCL